MISFKLYKSHWR